MATTKLPIKRLVKYVKIKIGHDFFLHMTLKMTSDTFTPAPFRLLISQFWVFLSCHSASIIGRGFPWPTCFVYVAEYTSVLFLFQDMFVQCPWLIFPFFLESKLFTFLPYTGFHVDLFFRKNKCSLHKDTPAWQTHVLIRLLTFDCAGDCRWQSFKCINNWIGIYNNCDDCSGEKYANS